MLLDTLGLVLAAYTAYAAWQGEVIAKSGPFARRIERSERPRYFWTVIGIYAALALALVLVF